MKSPSLQQMIGQLFIIGFKGDSLFESDVIYQDIQKRYLGGVILFDRHLATQSTTNNITGQTQLRSLTKQLQGVSDTKLLIGVDQEGGRVNRFRKEFGFSQTASAATLGGETDTTLTKKHGAQTARTLKSCGINMNFAPVVDLNSNSQNPIIGLIDRSFSEDVTAVIMHACAWVTEHRKQGIGSCLKHFPGHGSSENDSHLGFVDITESWEKRELAPYTTLIDKGVADAVMVGHLYNKNIDATFPATLSEKTITGILRKKLKFEGVVISDDLQMKAITEKYGLAEACIAALNAGVDLIIIGNNLEYDPELYTALYNGVIEAVDNGVISENTIKGAYERVQRLKSNIA